MKEQVFKLFNTPRVDAEHINTTIWEWAKLIVENPDNLNMGLDGIQNELQEANLSLIVCLLLMRKFKNIKFNRDKLLGLYLGRDLTGKLSRTNGKAGFGGKTCSN